MIRQNGHVFASGGGDVDRWSGGSVVARNKSQRRVSLLFVVNELWIVLVFFFKSELPRLTYITGR